MTRDRVRGTGVQTASVSLTVYHQATSTTVDKHQRRRSQENAPVHHSPLAAVPRGKGAVGVLSLEAVCDSPCFSESGGVVKTRASRAIDTTGTRRERERAVRLVILRHTTRQGHDPLPPSVGSDLLPPTDCPRELHDVQSPTRQGEVELLRERGLET